jgi:hypothetical protein
MGADWPVLLLEYQRALVDFERVTRALTAALVYRDSDPEHFPHLFAAETQARDVVTLTRMRLVNAGREAQPDFELPIPSSCGSVLAPRSRGH